MKYISMFSGIEAASQAWIPLGWEAVAFSEIEKFPCAVLKHHYPQVPNLGDVTKITKKRIQKLGKIDLAVFGFPCQDLSMAGKRKGMRIGKKKNGKKTRSGLFYDAMRVSTWAKVKWIVAENVPGLLSSKGGADFAAVLSRITGLAVPVPEGGWQNAGFISTQVPGRWSVSWAVDDAQFCGVPQRRKRVFIVGCAGENLSPIKVLLEPKSMCRDSSQGQEERKGSTSSTGSGIERSDKRESSKSHWEDGKIHPTLNQSARGTGGVGASNQELFSQGGAYLVPSQSKGDKLQRPSKRGGGLSHDASHETYVTEITHTLRGEGFDASEDGTGRGTPLVAVPMAFSSKDSGGDVSYLSPTLRAGGHIQSHPNAGVPPAVIIPPQIRKSSLSTGKTPLLEGLL